MNSTVFRCGILLQSYRSSHQRSTAMIQVIARYQPALFTRAALQELGRVVTTGVAIAVSTEQKSFDYMKVHWFPQANELRGGYSPDLSIEIHVPRSSVNQSMLTSSRMLELKTTIVESRALKDSAMKPEQVQIWIRWTSTHDFTV